MGGVRLSKLCASTENHIRNDDMAAAVANVPAIAAEHHTLSQELQHRRAELAA